MSPALQPVGAYSFRKVLECASPLALSEGFLGGMSERGAIVILGRYASKKRQRTAALQNLAEERA